MARARTIIAMLQRCARQQKGNGVRTRYVLEGPETRSDQLWIDAHSVVIFKDPSDYGLFGTELERIAAEEALDVLEGELPPTDAEWRP
jgi:hypothetical protein